MITEKKLETLIHNKIKDNFEHEFLADKDSFTVSIEGKFITIDNLIDTADECADNYDEDNKDFGTKEEYIEQERRNLEEFDQHLTNFINRILKKNGFNPDLYEINW
jgi:hypothetical protein